MLGTELQIALQKSRKSNTARQRRRGQPVPLLLCLFLTLSGLTIAQTQPMDDAAFVSALGEMREANYADKASIVDRIGKGGHPSAKAVLTALAEDRLFFRSSDQAVFVVKSGDENPLNLIDPVSLKEAGTAPSDAMTQIGTNNALRRAVTSAVARFALASPDASVRLDAVREMLKSPDDSSIALLRERLKTESDAGVKKEISIGLALAALDGSDSKARVDAIRALRGITSQDVRNRLAALIEMTADGNFVEQDKAVREAAASAVSSIDLWRSVYSAGETLFFGISLGSVLVLIAIGLSITFGVMGVINMAHGELMMLGAYTTYVVQTFMPNQIGWSILAAIPAAFLVSGLVGVLMERLVIRHLYQRPLETLLATFGLSLVLQQGVRSIFTALNRSVVTPDWMSGSLRVNDALEITYNRLYIVIFTLIVFALIQMVLRKTKLGLSIRAVSQNRSMARAMGIRSEWVDAMTFGLGSGIAGVAGVALSQLTNVGPNLGQAYIIDSFMVVVFGGVGNLWGSLIGGLSMGIVNKLLEPYAGAVLAKIFVLIGLILFIQIRPRGLFPQAGRAAEDK